MSSDAHHTPEELLETAHLLRLYCTDGDRSERACARMTQAADLIENFVAAIQPMVTEIEAAIALVNQSFEEDQALADLPTNDVGRAN